MKSSHYGLGVLRFEVSRYQTRQIEGYVRLKLAWSDALSDTEKSIKSPAVKPIKDNKVYLAHLNTGLQVSPIELSAEAMNMTLNTKLKVTIEQCSQDETSSEEIGQLEVALAPFIASPTEKALPIGKHGILYLRAEVNDDLSDFFFGARWLSIESASAPEIPKSWWCDRGEAAPKQLELELKNQALIPFALSLPPVTLKTWKVPIEKPSKPDTAPIEEENEDLTQDQDAAPPPQEPEYESKWSATWTKSPSFSFLSADTLCNWRSLDTSTATITLRRMDTRWPVTSFDVSLDALLTKDSIEIWNDVRTVRLVLRASSPIRDDKEKCVDTKCNDLSFLSQESHCNLGTIKLQQSLRHLSTRLLEDLDESDDEDATGDQAVPTGEEAKMHIKEAVDLVVSRLAKEMAKISLSKQPGGLCALPKVDETDERRWLFVLNDSGLYHELKESLKPKIQAMVAYSDYDRDQSKERFLSELYGELSACCNVVLNTRFRLAQTQLLEAANNDQVTLPEDITDSSATKHTVALTELEGRLEFCESRLADEEATAMEFEAITRQHRACLDVVLGSEAAVLMTQLDTEDKASLSQLRAVVWRRIAQSVLGLAGRRCFPNECESELAVIPLKKALALDPNHGPSLVLMAAVLLETGDDKAAAVVAGRSIEICASGAREFQVLSYVVNALRLSFSEDRHTEARLALISAVDCVSTMEKEESSQEKTQKRQRRSSVVATEANRLDAVTSARERVRVLLDAADWAASNGLRRCAQRAVELAGQAEARAQGHASLLNSEPRQRLTPTILRSHALHARAAVALLCGRIAAAEHDALKLTVLAPDHANTWLLLGAVYDIKHENNASRAVTIENDFTGSARSKKAANALARALAILQTDRVEPPPLWLYCRVADYCLQLGDYSTASNVYIDACRRYRKSAAAWRGAGFLFIRLDQPFDAEFALEEANSIDKYDAGVWALLALCNLRLYRDDGQDPVRLERAISVLDQALSLNLDHSEILCQLGVSFAEVDRRALAIDLLSRANELARSTTEALRARLALARTHAAQNSLEDAARTFASVLALEPPSSLSIQTELDDILRRLGKHSLPE